MAWCPIAHTEGGGGSDPNNRELLLRTLAGFVVHPNVGAVLAVDYGSEAVTNKMLWEYMVAHGYPLGHVRHCFMSLDGSFAARLEEGDRQVAAWAEEMADEERGEHDLSHLKIALQCGGSDAFSGISGNPLAAWVARELIRYGGAANLAETDELIGAEPYVLQNVKDVETARTFLQMVERFKERVSWHGASAEGNPSGGNKFRGLYNIALKSIGAARKRDPDVRLDYAIEYGEPLKETGFYFMDSPGNDLESIAGQVASGCNAIFFVTGNGSITNFPFVPTIKIVTTSERYELLAADLDVNAGAYLDGTPMDELGSGAIRAHLAGGLGRTLAGRASRPRPSVHLAQLATDRYQSAGRTIGRSRAQRSARASAARSRASRIVPHAGRGYRSGGVGIAHQPVRWPDRPHVCRAAQCSASGPRAGPVALCRLGPHRRLWAVVERCHRANALAHHDGLRSPSAGSACLAAGARLRKDA